MTSRMGIWRTAKLLVDQHWADVPIRAAQRADELLAGGDMAGRAVWLGIFDVVKELMGTKLRGPAH